MLKNGSKLKDVDGNVYEVVSVAMMNFKNPAGIFKSITVLMPMCDIKIGSILQVI